MNNGRLKSKTREWFRRYIPAEVVGTTSSLVVASIVYSHTHSYLTAAGYGWATEGIGFYGYFITAELLLNHRKYSQYKFTKRISLAIATASTNLLVEFMPAEILDNFLIRPFAMYIAPQYIHPYPLGFLVGKFSADVIFYVFAIIGYEARKHWLHR